MNQKDSRHAFDVAIRRTNEIAVSPRTEHARDGLRIEILPPFGSNEPKGCIETAFWIGKARQVFEVVWFEEPVSTLLG